MNSHGLHVMVIVALASSPIVAEGRPIFAQARASAAAGAALPGAIVLAQAAPASVEPIALPPMRDYEAIPELEDVHFDFGKVMVKPSDERILDANAAWLRAHPEYLILIEGHCDDRGVTTSKKELNMALGEQRAEAAMNDLVARGVQPGRITILSYGEERPVCSEPSERCWTRNRRARFLVKPR